METESSPTEPFPLGNRVIHANIQSIEPEGDDGSPDNSQGVLSDEQKNARNASSEMQLWWDEAIAKNMELPDYYRNVSVLIIKWDDELDELKTGPEVIELDALFRNSFHYNTRIVELNVAKKPQHQLNRHISTFVEDCDGENNLMIVYYTGHGVYREHERYLELTASTKLSVKRGLNIAAQANWDKAEEALRDENVDGDVLTILDTCFSSNLTKSGREDTRTYELLSACGLDGTTARPGENSFTRALIDSMKELLVEFPDRSFTTFHLNQRIILHPNRRDTPSLLWDRLRHHERHIRLCPLKPESDQTRKRRPPPGGYLTLRFAIRDEKLNSEQIQLLTRHLSEAFNNKAMIGVRSIDWMGIKPARVRHFRRAALALQACQQWKKMVKRRRLQRMQQHPTPESDQTFLGPNRKRTQDEMSFEPADERESKRDKHSHHPRVQCPMISPLTPPS
ncbi:hypothetical protein BU16DRAFT_555792 [Lophium mytilinum]|uniref:Uncharacterized protein n=1 Tax=Lophium mytilinum TaxID=390894 RepID=A0A6A6R9H8_9PEZI|nr:hypothetical protein BU16DRAFT_555792 [Lophium mytilinum]